jgi:hypothetical protein
MGIRPRSTSPALGAFAMRTQTALGVLLLLAAILVSAGFQVARVLR